MSLGSTVSQWPAHHLTALWTLMLPPPPHSDTPLCVVVVWHCPSGTVATVGDTRTSPDHRHVLTAEAVLGVWGAVRELRCEERMLQLFSTSAASIAASSRRCRRGGAGLSADPPAVIRGEEKPGGRCYRGEENDASWKGHPCRLILQRTFSFSLQISPLVVAYCLLHSTA